MHPLFLTPRLPCPHAFPTPATQPPAQPATPFYPQLKSFGPESGPGGDWSLRLGLGRSREGAAQGRRRRVSVVLYVGDEDTPKEPWQVGGHAFVLAHMVREWAQGGQYGTECPDTRTHPRSVAGGRPRAWVCSCATYSRATLCAQPQTVGPTAQ